MEILFTNICFLAGLCLECLARGRLRCEAPDGLIGRKTGVCTPPHISLNLHLAKLHLLRQAYHKVPLPSSQKQKQPGPLALGPWTGTVFYVCFWCVRRTGCCGALFLRWGRVLRRRSENVRLMISLMYSSWLFAENIKRKLRLRRLRPNRPRGPCRGCRTVRCPSSPAGPAACRRS